MGIIISKMVLCLAVALLIGLIFGYLLARARSKEYYEKKIDTLEELCESKKEEAKELKTKYGNMEVDIIRLKDQCKEYEETISACKKREENEQAVFEKKKDEIRAECEKEKEAIAAEYKQKEEQETAKFKNKEKELITECEKKRDEILDEYKKREEEMLSQLEMIAKKNETLQQKLDACISKSAESNFDTGTVLEQISEIAAMLNEKREILTETVKEEIKEEIEELKKEIQERPKSGKIAKFLQNIIKKIKS